MCIKPKLFRPPVSVLRILQSDIRFIIDFSALLKTDGFCLYIRQNKYIPIPICQSDLFPIPRLETTSKLRAHISKNMVVINVMLINMVVTLINMVVINEKTSNTCMTMCQGRNFTQTNKKEWRIIVIYDGMERTPNFEKGHFRDLKRQNNSWVPLLQCVF